MLSVFGVRHASLFTERPFWHGASSFLASLCPWQLHHFTTQGPGFHSLPVAKPKKEFGCQPDLGALGSEGIGDFVHFGLFLASSRHLRSSLGTWQRSLKNWLNLPMETQACSRLLVFFWYMRRLQQTEKGWGWLSLGFQVSTFYHSAPFPFSSSSRQDSCVPVLLGIGSENVLFSFPCLWMDWTKQWL